jgi:glycosyltransferase involved in cell wall biosynthesis
MKQPYFVYVGNAYPHKNLTRAVQASPITFAVVCSRNVFTKRLEALEGQLRLLGFVPDGELKKIYQNAVAFVYPSLYEGFGLPGLEAMAAGTLVLASDIPVFREIYQDNALYFNPKEVSSIKETMRRAINMDTRERQKRISQSQQFIKKYSWARMAKQTLQVYNEALK